MKGNKQIKLEIKRGIILSGVVMVCMGMMPSCRMGPDVSFNEDRQIIDLADLDWKLWLDSLAIWSDDTLYLPPVNLEEIQVDPPGCGWENLYSMGRDIHIPATVEQYHWDNEKDTNGISGDYRGVSWFTTIAEIPVQYQGKRVLMKFESVRLRAEVFVNDKLAGYDIIGNTPFIVDITRFIHPGKSNRLAVRITDPSGNFDWADYHLDRWGRYYIPPSHGFGGITGRVHLYTTDSISIADVFIRNTPKINAIDANISLQNLTGKTISGMVTARIYESLSPACLLQKQMSTEIKDTLHVLTIPLCLPDAAYWSPDHPSLYRLEVAWAGHDGSHDLWKDRFGFRWFEIREVNGDRQLFLNGRRIFLASAISWGFWPANGIFPEHNLASKQVEIAKHLGLNMLNFHRAIGDPLTLAAADETGLLIYEEPGGYRCPDNNIWFWDLSGDSSTVDRDDICLAWEWRRIKLKRMIERDRNHPSLVIYNLQNEILHDPDSVNVRDIQLAHEMDPTRIITYSSNSFEPPYMIGDYDGVCPDTPAAAKMYMEPLSREIRYMGWWDQHFAAGPGAYIDKEHYNHPGNYYHFTHHRDEIIFYGEDGAIGGPSRLALIRRELEDRHKGPGWDGEFYLRTADSLEKFLDRHGFTGKGINMDDYLVSMGNVAYHYHGRIIENCRINNVVDAYVINGWENSKISNFSGMVDIFRNPKGNPEILARYNKPAYIAVKLRNKVLPSGAGTMADFYLVNQLDIRGDYNLRVIISNGPEILSEFNIPVHLEGGNVFGQLLLDGLPINPENNTFHGYLTASAEIPVNDKLILKGSDELFMVHAKQVKHPNAEVYDESGRLLKFLITGSRLSEYSGGKPLGDCLVLGAVTQPLLDTAMVNWIRDGHTLLILHDADRWMAELSRHGLVPVHERTYLDNLWFGGHFFVKVHPLFRDLPVNTAFDWEYQVLSRYSANRYSLVLEGGECVVGSISREGPEIGTAVGILPCGNGRIIFSTLDILPNLDSGEEASVVARKILYNYLDYVAE